MEETIENKCHNVNNHPSIQCPFLHIDGKVYVKNYRLALESHQGIIFANYCMTNLENTPILITNPTWNPSFTPAT